MLLFRFCISYGDHPSEREFISQKLALNWKCGIFFVTFSMCYVFLVLLKELKAPNPLQHWLGGSMEVINVKEGIKG